MPNKKESLLSREYIMLTCINFFMSINFYTLLLVIPPYGIEKFNMSEWEAGLGAGLFVVGVLSSRFFSATLIDKTGFKKLLSICVIVLVVFSAGYFVVLNPFMLFALRIINGFAFGLISTIDITIVTLVIPANRTGEGIGYYAMGQILATAVGPSIGMYFLNGADGADYNTIFAICTILPAITIAFLPFMRINQIAPKSKTGVVKNGNIIDKFIERRVLKIGWMCLLIFISYASVSSFMALYAESIDLVQPAKYFFIFVAVSMFVSRPSVSKIFDRKGANIVIFPALLMFALGFLLLSLSKNGVTLTISALLIGLGLGGVQSSTLAMVFHISPMNRLVVANSTYYMFLDTAMSVGPVIGGAIVGVAGYREMYFIGFILLMICIPIYYVFYGKHARKSESGIVKHDSKADK